MGGLAEKETLAAPSTIWFSIFGSIFLLNCSLTSTTEERVTQWIGLVSSPPLKSVINVSRVHFLLVILHKLPSVCSLCISYLHWINVSHWWQVFKSMFINGFFKCLKIKSLTYWWSFRSCPGREKEPELERVWRAAELTPAATEQEAGGRKEEAEEEEEEEERRASWERGVRLHSPMQSFLWLLKKRHVARANFTWHGSQWAPRLRPRRCWMNLTCKNMWIIIIITRSWRICFCVVFFWDAGAVGSDWFYHSAATCRGPSARRGDSLSHLIRYLIHNKSILISFMFGGRRRGLSAARPPSSITLTCSQPPVICTPDIS